MNEKESFTDIGKQAAYLYNGAFEVLKNDKLAERVVFLFFSAIMFGNNKTMTMLFNMFGDEK